MVLCFMSYERGMQRIDCYRTLNSSTMTSSAVGVTLTNWDSTYPSHPTKKGGKVRVWVYGESASGAGFVERGNGGKGGRGDRKKKWGREKLKL